DRIGDDRHEPGIVTGRPRLTAAGILGIGRERKSACKQNRSARDPQGVTHTVPSRVNVPNPPERPATRRWASTVIKSQELRRNMAIVGHEYGIFDAIEQLLPNVLILFSTINQTMNVVAMAPFILFMPASERTREHAVRSQPPRWP